VEKGEGKEEGNGEGKVQWKKGGVGRGEGEKEEQRDGKWEWKKKGKREGKEERMGYGNERSTRLKADLLKSVHFCIRIVYEKYLHLNWDHLNIAKKLNFINLYIFTAFYLLVGNRT
jgi:hypothetical protein